MDNILPIRREFSERDYNSYYKNNLMKTLLFALQFARALGS